LPKPAVYNWIASNTQAICLTQNGVAGVPLLINGASAAAPFGSNVIRTVSITSANNLAAINFTIVGFNQGTSISVTIAGPNAATVETVGVFFDTITSITPSANAAAVSIGNGGNGSTYWFNSVLYGPYYTTYSANVLAGVVDYTLQLTAESDVTLPGLLSIDPTGVMTNKITSELAGLTTLFPFTFSRFVLINTTGSMRFSVLQTFAAS
jgi:hypothetical protein